jgi:hypothetical protein
MICVNVGSPTGDAKTTTWITSAAITPAPA